MEISNPSPASLNLSNPDKTLEESVTSLNQTLERNPGDAVARQALYETMQKILRKDAFLAYQGETNVLYQVSTLGEFQFIQPKDRALFDLFPSEKFSPERAAMKWLGWSIAGLIPAGLGTLFCAPLAMIAAIKLLRQPTSAMDHRRAWVVLIVAITLWLLALGFLFILYLHLE
jgi:hypothetical protein